MLLRYTDLRTPLREGNHRTSMLLACSQLPLPDLPTLPAYKNQSSPHTPHRNSSLFQDPILPTSRRETTLLGHHSLPTLPIRHIRMCHCQGMLLQHDPTPHLGTRNLLHLHMQGTLLMHCFSNDLWLFHLCLFLHGRHVSTPVRVLNASKAKSFLLENVSYFVKIQVIVGRSHYHPPFSRRQSSMFQQEFTQHHLRHGYRLIHLGQKRPPSLPLDIASHWLWLLSTQRPMFLLSNLIQLSYLWRPLRKDEYPRLRH